MPELKIARLGIISALQEEQAGLVEAMEGAATHFAGGRDYTTGTLWGLQAVCVLSRIGKVAAAITTALLVEKFGVTHILFTGVAGAGGPAIKVGDIVIADSLVQHDMDASPLFPPYVVPLTGISHFLADQAMSDQLYAAAKAFLDEDGASETTGLGPHDKTPCGLREVTVRRGLVASGDQFIHSRERIAALGQAHPGLLAVEMEGAAVAQACVELGVPFAVLRTISDNANEKAATDFLQFVQAVAAPYARAIIARFCRQLVPASAS